MKIMQSAKAYRDKPTIDKKFSAEIWTFYKTSFFFFSNKSVEILDSYLSTREKELSDDSIPH